MAQALLQILIAYGKDFTKICHGAAPRGALAMATQTTLYITSASLIASNGRRRTPLCALPRRMSRILCLPRVGYESSPSSRVEGGGGCLYVSPQVLINELGFILAAYVDVGCVKV